MTRHRFLLEVLDEGVAFERWTEDGHTEACFEAADGLHRAVAAQAAGQDLAEDPVASKALQDACALCRADLQDALALIQDFTANAHGSPVEKVSPTLSAALSTPIPEPALATLRDGEVQRADRPAPTRGDARRSDAVVAARPSADRRWGYAVAAMLVTGIAIVTLALLWQQHVTSRSHHSTRAQSAPPSTNRAPSMTTTTPTPMAVGPSRRTTHAPSSGRARVPVMHRLTPPRPAMVRPPAMRRAPAPPRLMDSPIPILSRKKSPVQDSKDKRYGYLRINTIPWTRIWVDGRFRGTTPQLKLKLRIGRRKLELRNRQHAIRYTTYITINATRPTTIVKRFNRP